MRFTSLIVELVRARPKLVVWVAVLLQAALWIVVPSLIYASPPEDVATVLAFGREYQVGTDLGPPLPFWLADMVFRLAGNHVVGVYLLAEACFVVTMLALFRLSSAVVGRQQAALAVLLTATLTMFSFPGLEFGPAVLARPLWALVLLHAWRVAGQGSRLSWFALTIESGLLLLTTPAAALLLALVFVFLLATRRGRRALLTPDPWFALAVIVVMVLPYVVWLARFSWPHWPPLPPLAELTPRAERWGELLGGLLLTMSGIAILLVVNSRRWTRKPDEVPEIYRPPVDPYAQRFVFFFALAPVLAATLVSAAFGLGEIFGGAGTVMLLVGLAVIVVSGDLIPLRRQETLRTVWAVIIAAPAAALVVQAVVQPWIISTEVSTALPARAMAQFFGENFQHRTGKPLPAVAGDPRLATLVALGLPQRPHVFFAATPDRTPWFSAAKFRETGGVVVWRAADTAGPPPAEIVRQFPDLAPELPRAFERMVNGRQPLLRLGWGVVRPASR
ncbi:MAG: glycosyltransferase family 39 protein [Xanthobacteraceae bacterium]|nr:glycosyltransferase family 39 protein [Xanthobacteraceae bacterium]